LHLGVSMRSFRAEALSDFVGHVLDNRADLAAETYGAIKDRYPIALTRNIDEALNSTIDTVSAEVRGNEAVPPSQKTRVIVNQLHDMGIFELKDSAQIAARQLGISVHSIYRYLREIKKG
jgi:predicted transcriptional regulator YheO